MNLDTLVTIGIALGVASITVMPYYSRVRRKEKKARRTLQELKLTGMDTASTMHPHFDALACIGCGTCVSACPEGDVIAVIGGKATLVHGSKCVGHGLCAEACPVGAISMVMAPPGKSASIPVLDKHLQTSVPGLFIAGELGGMGLIKNAVTQGCAVVDHIAARPRTGIGALDVVIIGAGPAGLAAGLTAMRHELQFAVLEQEDIGGTILQYPRQKIVMTSPVELPLWGKLNFREVSKEELLSTWQKILSRTRLPVRTHEKVVDIQRVEDGFQVISNKDAYHTRNVVLALGRRGTPRKLGVSGEKLGKVMYRLIDAGEYHHANILVVGGGDSAVEAAAALAMQAGNRVSLSYRQAAFGRIKARNQDHLKDLIGKKRIHPLLGSRVMEINEKEVVLETTRGREVLPNDYVFVCIGGEMPFGFLERVGIGFHRTVVTDAPPRGPREQGLVAQPASG